MQPAPIKQEDKMAEKKEKDTGVFNVKAKDGELVSMFVKIDELNPQNKYVYGSINGKEFQYESGRVHKLPYAIAEHLYYCNLAYPV